VTGPGQGFDAVVGAAGIDRIEALANNTEIGLRSIASLEQVTADSLSGLFTGVRIIGSAANDTLNFSAVTLTSIVEINGGAGADTLTGSDAADVIVGGPGDDALTGAGGDDVFVTAGVAHGFDAVTGGAGVDRVEAVAGNVRIGLRSVASLERITSGGNPNVGVLGSTGNDTLNFGGVTFSGISDVDANAGADNVTGSAAADALFGGAGNDTINGGGGVDSITGGIGNDTMNGGAGNDFFRFGAGFGADTVAGFDANATGGQDLLDVSALGITAANLGSSVTISAVAGGTRLTIGTNTITLNGVAPASLSSADFVLA
jgi:Ca2+-binding RTX toxin-like protein